MVTLTSAQPHLVHSSNLYLSHVDDRLMFVPAPRRHVIDPGAPRFHTSIHPGLVPKSVHMPDLVLASGSAIRSTLLSNAGIAHRVIRPRVDEDAARSAILAEGASPRDLADALAEFKAARVAQREPGLVLGCDQVLAQGRTCLTKPATPADAEAQLTALAGQTHMLLSAAVLCEAGQPIWRHTGQARLTMRPLTPAQIATYVTRNWDSIRHAVGCYKLEESGIRLFTAIEGSYFTILGLPLLELADFLIRRGTLDI